MEGQTGKSETPKSMAEEIDEFVEMRGGDGYITESTLTPHLPKDETIYALNNKYGEFSWDGIDERCESYLEQRESNLLESKGKASSEELGDIQSRLDIVHIKMENNKIHDRFEILDL